MVHNPLKRVNLRDYSRTKSITIEFTDKEGQAVDPAVQNRCAAKRFPVPDSSRPEFFFVPLHLSLSANAHIFGLPIRLIYF